MGKHGYLQNLVALPIVQNEHQFHNRCKKKLFKHAAMLSLGWVSDTKATWAGGDFKTVHSRILSRPIISHSIPYIFIVLQTGIFYWSRDLQGIMLSSLPPTYVVCGKVMFSLMFVCQSVQLLGGSHVNFAHDALGHSIVVYKSIMG